MEFWPKKEDEPRFVYTGDEMANSDAYSALRLDLDLEVQRASNRLPERMRARPCAVFRR